MIRLISPKGIYQKKIEKKNIINVSKKWIFIDNTLVKNRAIHIQKKPGKNRKRFLKLQNYREKYRQRNFNRTQVIDKEINITLYNHKLYLKYIGITDE
ncbi:hypothetical protein DDI74_13725 [Chryseobacterium gleum]|nr:hypothetical protein DDI74_13725 [Chryseobacterium gleum]